MVVQTSEINKQTNSAEYKWCSAKSLSSLYLKWQRAVFFIQTVRRGSWMRSVQCCTKWPVLVTVCVCVWSVCVCVWCGGGKDGREFSFLTAWWMKLSFSLLVLAWRLRSLLPDGSRLNKLCVGWVGSPAMQRALVWAGGGCCKCPGGRGERHQRSSQLLSLSVEGTCGRTRCRRHTTQWCS